MDPLSVGFGVAGLVPLVASAIKLARNYWAGVRGAKEKVATLITELEALQSNLNALHNLLDENGPESQNPACDQSSVLMSCSTACRVKLEALVRKLDRPGLVKGKMGVLKWPFEEKEYKETISEFRNLTAWMQFSLSIGGYRLLSSSSADVLKTLREHLSHFEDIKHHQIKLRRDLEQQRDVPKTLKREKQDLLNWLSVLNVQAQHDKIHAARTKHTGTWFLQDETFLRWRDDRAESHLLWCHGLPGSGKTVLSSLAVDELSKESPGSRAVACFYFNYREAHEQDPQTVLSCLIRQVAATLDEIPPELMQMKLTKGNSGRLNLEDCKQMMAICLAETERTYLILDGLDECDLSKHRKILLNTLHDLAELPQTRLLVTSRSHVQDIARSFGDIPQLKIVAHDEDLEEYMSEELCTALGSDDLDEELTTRIRVEITKRANGMFLLAVLQLRSIVNEPTPGEMEDALDSMSKDLTGAFEDTISRIKTLPKNRAQLGMDVLMWLCHSRRVMSTEELSDALAFRKARESKLAKYRPSLNMILECCHGLVVLSADTEYIELAHYSIQEYLRGHSEVLFPLYEQDIASTCLGYLMLDDFKRGPQYDYQLIQTRLCNLPFSSYAAGFWDKHVKDMQTLEPIWPLLLDFVYHNGAISSSVQIGRFERGFRWIYMDPRECLSRTPMHNASEYGLEGLLRMMLEKPDASSIINSETEIVGTTPVIMAASSGHVKLVRLLLQHGADPFISNWYGNALHCAAEADQPEVIAELVSFGMSPNDCHENRVCELQKSPVLCTLDRDSVCALKALINLGASLDVAEDGCACCEQPFLHQAAEAGASKIVDYVVHNGLADVNAKSNTGETAFDRAIASRSSETIRTLLKVGANCGEVISKSTAELARLGLGR